MQFLTFDSGLELSLLDQMKLVYESNACSVEHLIISSRECSKSFVSENSPSSSSSSCGSDGDEPRDVDVS